MTSYAALIRHGWVIDDRAGVDGVADVAVAGDQIAAVGPELAGTAEWELDASGCFVVPGLVDLHVHLAHPGLARSGHAALARAGVTTALDLGGPIGSGSLDGPVGAATLGSAGGAGITVATLERLVPDGQLPRSPTIADVDRALQRVLAAGGLGVKMHVDSGWAPEQIHTIVHRAAAAGAWVAVHCGSTTAASTIDGLRQSIELAGHVRVQIAHVNSYCRGEVADPRAEADQAIALLRGAPQHLAESYLSELNGTTAECVDGRPANPRLGQWLRGAGYPGTEDGLQRALSDGWAQVGHVTDDRMTLLTGEDGVRVWRDAGTRTMLCLPLNPALPRVLLATSRNGAGAFDVGALATDGGIFPRNVTLAAGLALVELGFLTRRELVRKACRTPAAALGLAHKGHLAPGADADLTVVHRATREVIATLCAGRLVAHRGAILGRGVRLITTPLGREAAARTTAPVDEIPLGGPFHDRH